MRRNHGQGCSVASVSGTNFTVGVLLCLLSYDDLSSRSQDLDGFSEYQMPDVMKSTTMFL